MNISVADIQAALWFHEKELFSKLGVASEKAKPADYEDAAKHTMNLINNGDLYNVKSKQAKKQKDAPDEAYASGGGIPHRAPMPHPAMRIPGVHIVTSEAGEPFFHG